MTFSLLAQKSTKAGIITILLDLTLYNTDSTDSTLTEVQAHVTSEKLY